jgi:hypothetical protein
MNFQGNGKSNQVNLEFPTLLHMGRRKIVTGGPEDSYAIVWKANNRHRTSAIKRIRLRYSEDERASKLGSAETLRVLKPSWRRVGGTEEVRNINLVGLCLCLCSGGFKKKYVYVQEIQTFPVFVLTFFLFE